MTADGAPTPRTGETITTAAELDTLPVGLVLRTVRGYLTEIVLDDRGRRYVRATPDTGGDGGWYTHAERVLDMLPITVVFRPDAPQPATTDDLAAVAAAVTEAYQPAGQAIWWRSWAEHPERRAAMQAGVLGAWSGETGANADPIRYTPRGFPVWAEFVDRYDQQVTVVTSSLATEDCLWVQPGDGKNVHLTVDNARVLRDAIDTWLATGPEGDPDDEVEGGEQDA